MELFNFSEIIYHMLKVRSCRNSIIKTIELLIYFQIKHMAFLTFSVVVFVLTGVSTGLLSCILYNLMKHFGDFECDMERVNEAWKRGQGGQVHLTAKKSSQPNQMDIKFDVKGIFLQDGKSEVIKTLSCLEELVYETEKSTVQYFYLLSGNKAYEYEKL